MAKGGNLYGFYGGPNVRFISHPTSARGYNQLICKLCTRKAIYHCGGDGYCRVHKHAAVARLSSRRDNLELRDAAIEKGEFYGKG